MWTVISGHYATSAGERLQPSHDRNAAPAAAAPATTRFPSDQGREQRAQQQDDTERMGYPPFLDRCMCVRRESVVQPPEDRHLFIVAHGLGVWCRFTSLRRRAPY